MIVALAIVALPLAFAFGWFIVAPLPSGFKPFTTPMQAARGERRLRR